MKTVKKENLFPKEIYIQRETDENDSYLIPKDLEYLTDDAPVAIYELKEVKDVKITIELV